MCEQFLSRKQFFALVERFYFPLRKPACPAIFLSNVLSLTNDLSENKRPVRYCPACQFLPRLSVNVYLFNLNTRPPAKDIYVLKGKKALKRGIHALVASSKTKGAQTMTNHCTQQYISRKMPLNAGQFPIAIRVPLLMRTDGNTM